MKIIFFGTPEFGATILGNLIKKSFKPVLVITAPDKPAGRGKKITSSPVKKLALKHRIKVFQPEKLSDKAIQLIEQLKPELGVLASYGKILPAKLIEIFPKGIINVHPSLLPKYRGPSPVSEAILQGEEKTGVTLALLTPKVDAGPILSQEEIPISPKDTTPRLTKKLALLGSKVLLQVLPLYLKGSLKLRKQDEEQATYTHLIIKKQGQINWRKSATFLDRQIRAFTGWPGSFTFWKKNSKKIRLQIIKARAETLGYHFLEPGRVFLDKDKNLSVACKRGYLVIEKIKPEGKRKLSAQEFLNGYPEIIDQILG